MELFVKNIKEITLFLNVQSDSVRDFACFIFANH